MTNVNPRTIEASKMAALFLLSPNDHRIDREAEQEIARDQLRATVENLVRAGLTDLAMATLDLSHQVEVASV